MSPSRWTPLEVVLACALVAVATVYSYFFLVVPPDWTLRDDYSFVLEWTAPGADVWALGKKYLETIIGTGRFQPVDALSRVLHYGYLPVTPRAFRLTYFALAGLALFATHVLLARSGLGRAQRLLALLLIASNLAFKEWLTTLTVSEAYATTFLMIALALYATGRRWLALPVFLLSLFSKESFFITCGVFAALELGASTRTGKRAARWAPAAAAVALSAAFVVFVRSLPALYTTGLSFSKLLDVGAVARSFALPPLKSFGPALAFLGLGALALPLARLPRKSLALAAAGAYLAIAFTLLLNAWGPFDSWFYLHTAVPFGWAFVIAALWQPRNSRLETAAALATLVFSVAATANGARNYVSYFANAKTAALVACEEARRVPGLRVFSNCHEGSHQLGAFLKLSPQSCARAPEISYLAGATRLDDAIRPPFLVLLSAKCDPFDESSAKAGHLLRLDAWTVLKRF